MDINQTFETIIALYNSGGNPNTMIQTMYANNPNMNKMATQFNNMMQGKSRNEAYIQIAKQLGLNEQNMKGLEKMLGIKQEN